MKKKKKKVNKKEDKEIEETLWRCFVTLEYFMTDECAF